MPCVRDQRFRIKDRPFWRLRPRLAPRLSPGPVYLVDDGADGRAILAEHSARLPVIMTTGSGDLAAPALKAGATAFVQIPFGRSKILSVPKHLGGGAGGD